MDFFFPTISMNTSCCHVPTYVEEVQKCFKEAYAEAQHKSNSEVDRQKHNYDKYMGTVQLMQGDMVLKKANACSRKKEGERSLE